MEQDRVPCLVVRGDALLLLGDDAALFLCADAHLHEGLADIRLGDIRTVVLGCQNGCLVHQIFQIRAGHACGGLGYLLQIHILCQRLILRMNLQNLFSAAHIRSAHHDLTVKTTRT